MRLDVREARALEPALRCVDALHSPSTGIVDSHALMLALEGDARDAGATLAFTSPVLEAASTQRRHRALDRRRGADERGRASRRQRAGLTRRAGAPIAGVPAARAAGRTSARATTSRSPASAVLATRLSDARGRGLGVHVTLDLAGQRALRSGRATAVEAIDYASTRPCRRLLSAIADYWPALPADALMPDYAGVDRRSRRRANRPATS